MKKLKEIAEKLVNLSQKEAIELAQILKDDYGIEYKDAQPMIIAPDTNIKEVEEQTQFEVFLKSAGQTKLMVIKSVKELTSLGLKEAKDLVDSAPVTIKKDVTKAEAEMLKNQLESIGAEVEIR